MRVNGFRLQQDIREAQEERNLLVGRFSPALKAFPGEDHDDPERLAAEVAIVEERIAVLQVAQTKFNLRTKVKVGDQEMPLVAAIKRLGGVERRVNLWREASAEDATTARRRGYYAETTRDADAVVAQRTVKIDRANDLRREARKEATALRAAIQSGNSQEVDATDIGYPV